MHGRLVSCFSVGSQAESRMRHVKGNAFQQLHCRAADMRELSQSSDEQPVAQFQMISTGARLASGNAGLTGTQHQL